MESKLLWCERGRWTEGHKDRLLYWPLTSSFDHTTLCYLQCLTSSLPMRHTQLVLTKGRLASRGHGSLSADSTPTHYNWLRLLRGHLHISFRNTDTFLINHITASTYFYRCVRFRESLNDSSVKGLYATDIVGVFYHLSQLGYVLGNT